MQEFKSFSERILKLKKEQFESLALELFQFQSKANPLYREYLRIRRVNVEEVKSLDQIPFLPIRFFKDHPVICGKPEDFKHFYSSSGTTGMITSKHYIWSEDWYLRYARQIFESTYGSLNDYHVLALLPAYLERPGSSLVAMAQHFIQVSDSEHSGFYLYNHDELLQKVNKLRHGSRKILLLGVTFALLDLADSNEPLDSVDNLMVMETGGMKGRRKEMIREEVHDTLKSYFG
ncbi:MAG: acyl transferase, partial [Algoriphagus sp. 32-45-6]